MYNLTMRNIIRFVVILLCCLRRVTASYCYPDYCQNLTDIIPTPGFQCLLTPVRRDAACVKLKFESPNHAPPKQDTTKFALYAYVNYFKKSKEKTTAFNLSISDIKFHRLVTRYQNMLNETQSACRYIELYGNATHGAPTELYVSCPFSDASFESFPYRLEYLVTGETFEYSKQYIFRVPINKYIEYNTNVSLYTPFVYVDITEVPILSLYVQPLPEKYNVTKYKIWLVNNDTNSTISTDISSVGSEQHVRYNCTAYNGVYYFIVAAMHPNCGEFGCANSTTPFIVIRETSHRLLIMIISTVWIPPVIMYALYHVYKLYKKNEARKRAKKSNCLLVYAPTRLSHINVLTELAKYLRGCNINAMIDILDVTDTSGKDAGAWCNSAFRNADTVLVATSPPLKQPAVSVIYRNIDDHFLRLLKENCPQKDKKYYTIEFPYCRPEDVPEEARHFKKFCLPKELPRLVKAIHEAENTRSSTASDKELLESLRIAKLEMLEEEASNAKDVEETDGLLTPSVLQKTTNNQADQNESVETSGANVQEGDGIPRSFTTNIDELNLLGESGEGEGETFVYKPLTSEGSFRIDQLNL